MTAYYFLCNKVLHPTAKIQTDSSPSAHPIPALIPLNSSRPNLQQHRLCCCSPHPPYLPSCTELSLLFWSPSYLLLLIVLPSPPGLFDGGERETCKHTKTYILQHMHSFMQMKHNFRLHSISVWTLYALFVVTVK